MRGVQALRTGFLKGGFKEKDLPDLDIFRDNDYKEHDVPELTRF